MLVLRPRIHLTRYPQTHRLVVSLYSHSMWYLNLVTYRIPGHSHTTAAVYLYTSTSIGGWARRTEGGAVHRRRET